MQPVPTATDAPSRGDRGWRRGSQNRGVFVERRRGDCGSGGCGGGGGGGGGGYSGRGGAG